MGYFVLIAFVIAVDFFSFLIHAFYFIVNDQDFISMCHDILMIIYNYSKYASIELELVLHEDAGVK